MQRLTRFRPVIAVWGYILNKSENATPELFAIYMHNDANQ